MKRPSCAGTRNGTTRSGFPRWTPRRANWCTQRTNYTDVRGHYYDGFLSGPLLSDASFFVSARHLRDAAVLPGTWETRPANIRTSSKLTVPGGSECEAEVRVDLRLVEEFQQRKYVQVRLWTDHQGHRAEPLYSGRVGCGRRNPAGQHGLRHLHPYHQSEDVLRGEVGVLPEQARHQQTWGLFPQRPGPTRRDISTSAGRTCGPSRPVNRSGSL